MANAADRVQTTTKNCNIYTNAMQVVQLLNMYTIKLNKYAALCMLIVTCSFESETGVRSFLGHLINCMYHCLFMFMYHYIIVYVRIFLS